MVVGRVEGVALRLVAWVVALKAQTMFGFGVRLVYGLSNSVEAQVCVRDQDSLINASLVLLMLPPAIVISSPCSR